MFHADNPVVIEPGMVFVRHMILLDSAAGLAMALGKRVVTAGGCESLSHLSHDLVVV